MYNLCDIHFHTNMSFDAYENAKGELFDVEGLCNSYLCNDENDELNVKLICMTDHNVFDYEYYLKIKAEFFKKNVVCLPGIEMNGDSAVHWVFIFDDVNLAKSNRGNELKILVNKTFGYDISKDILSQARAVQPNKNNIISFVEELITLKIDFLAIPHMDKSNGWYKILKKDTAQLERIKYLLCDGIINGFESKKMQASIIQKIEETEKYINLHSKEILELEEKINNTSDVNQKKDLENKRDMILKNLKAEEEYLEVPKKLNGILDINDTASVYGSDYHGKPAEHPYKKDDLIYIKSEASFNGLKFALFDWNSRIFSRERKEKYTKATNYIIKRINFNINNNKKTIEFGDGLNSIIGSRGTGKSYILSCLLGNEDTYIKSDIYKQIKLESIDFLNHASQKCLDEKYYDYISQKNGTSESGKNIYNLLAKAPYDYSEFRNGIENFFSPINSKTEIIEEAFKALNDLIRLFTQIHTHENKGMDLSFISNYNDFYGTQSEEVLVSNIFQSLDLKLEKNIENEETEINKVKGFVNTLDLLIKQFNQIKGYSQISKDLKDNELYKKDFGQLSDFRKTIVDSSLKTMERELKTDNLIEKKVKSILDSMSNNSNNTKNVLDDNMANLKASIIQYIGLLKETKEKNKDVEKYLNDPIIDNDVYSFGSGQSKFKLCIQDKLDWNAITKEQLNYIFKNYNTIQELTVNKFLDIFQKNDFGDYYIDKVYRFADKRRTSIDLIKPKIDPDVQFINNEKAIDWKSQSPGQRSDLLLECILTSKSSKILIIDQPEDDLDNETIFNKIVSLIRTIKLNRQVIIVTHNANLAISTDSDEIIICENNNNKFNIIADTMESNGKYKYHSINNDELNDTVINLACSILEGGKKAVKRRINKIGIRELLYEE